MSVYLFESVKSESNADNEHRLRGLLGRRCSLPHPEITIRNLFPNYVHASFMAAINRSIQATATNTKITSNIAHYAFPFATAPDLPLTLPDVIFTTKEAIDEAEIVRLALSPQRVRPGVHGYRIRNPTPASVAEVRRIPNVNQNLSTTGNFTSILGYLSLVNTRKLVNAFSMTQIHYIPNGSIQGHAMIDHGLFHECSYSTTVKDINDEDRDRGKAFFKEHRAAYGWPEVRGDLPFVTGGTVGALGYRKYFLPGLPATLPVMCADPGALPELPGIVFPFFPKMFDANAANMDSIVKDIFFGNLGDTAEVALATATRLYEGFKSVSRTNEGLILNHLLWGCSLSVKAVARLFIIARGQQYSGFVLQGDGFAAYVNGAKILPVTYQKCREIAFEMGTHDIALERIIRVLGDVEISARGNPDKGLKKIVLRTDVDSPRKIMLAIRQRLEAFTPDNKSEILLAANDLSFPDYPLLQITPGTLISFFTCVAQGKLFDNTVGIALKGESIFSNDPIVFLLLSFGLNPPSMHFPNHKRLRIAKDDENDTLLKVKEITIRTKKGDTVKKERPLQQLYVRRAPILEAAREWTEVFTKGTLGQPSLLDKRAASQYVTLKDDPMLAVWRGLRLFHKVVEDEEKSLEAKEVTGGTAVDMDSALF